MADVQVVSRMTEAAAVDVVKSRGSVQRWHADRRLGRSRRVVGIIVGQRTGSTHFFEAYRWQERECVVTVPADRTHHAGIARRVHLALVEGAGNPQP